MDAILISILPVLPLVLLIAFGIWIRAGRSPQAARMAERFDIRKQDEMEKEIQRKSLIASYYAMLCILGAYMLYKAWIERAGIGNVAFAAIFVAALTKGVATFVLRWRSTAGDEEYQPYPVWKTLLLLAAIVIGGTAVCFLLLIMVMSV